MVKFFCLKFKKKVLALCNSTHLLYKLSKKYKVTLGLYLRLRIKGLKSTALVGTTVTKELLKTTLWSFDSLNLGFLKNLKNQAMPSFTPRSWVREAPQILVDRQRNQRNEENCLRIFNSPESNTWQSTEAQNQGESSVRFSDTDRNPKKIF